MSDIIEIINLSMDMVKMNKQFYESTSIKRKRRTKLEMFELRSSLYEILLDDNPQTVRGVFYQATVNNIVSKSENSYKAVQRALSDMRKSGRLRFDWIADNTRWMRKPQTFTGLEAALHNSWQYYRRSVWNEQTDYIEIWLEKDALAGVIYPVASAWDVPLMVTRGYSSLSFLYESAEYITEKSKPTFIYYLGDYDPSGVDISLNVEKSLRRFAPDAEIHFERIAVTPEQISDWNLPTRPTKKTDTRSKNFRGESVELDAIPAKVLREMVTGIIESHINKQALNEILKAEEAEKKTLENIYHDYRSMIY